jgi:hypothetical protein
VKERGLAAIGAIVGAAFVGFFAAEASDLLGMSRGITFLALGFGVLVGGFVGLMLAIWAYEADWK